MSIKFDCQHNLSDDDCGKCSIMGYIFDCPDDCFEYIDWFGNKPNQGKGDLPLCP